MTDRPATNALLIEFAEEVQSLKRRVETLERERRRLELNYCGMKTKCKTGMGQDHKQALTSEE